VLDRPDRNRDVGGLAPREPEEPRQDLGLVLGGEHLRELDDRAEAKLPGAERRLHDGGALDELGRGLPVLRGAGGEAQLAMQERKETPVPQVSPPLLAVELREGDQKIGHRVALAAEQVGEAVREVACGRHAEMFARDFQPSGDAPGAAPSRERTRRLSNPRATARRARAARLRCGRGVLELRAASAVSVCEIASSGKSGVPPVHR
jgi:hypothetical protein